MGSSQNVLCISLGILLILLAIAVIKLDSPQAAFASFQGTNGRIAIDGITVMNADGAGAKSLTNDLGINAEPAWSPDGKRIAFVSTRDYPTDNTDVYLMNADGSNQTRLTHLGAVGRPTWSPDGKKIAFDGAGGVIVMDSDGTNQKVLVSEDFARPSPDWSPDGKKIAFMSPRDYVISNWEIYLMNADGSNQTRLTHTGSANYPSWSPDGTRIAFTDGSGEISIINANHTGQIAKIVTGIGGVNNAVWSPDGKKLVFEAEDSPFNTGPATYTVNADGSGKSTKIAPSFSMNPDWGTSPNLPPPLESKLTVISFDTSLMPISGQWITIRTMDGTIVKSGYTPLTFVSTAGLEYKVTAANYDGRDFVRWWDEEGTHRTRIINLSSDVTLRGIYTAGSALRGFTSLTYTGTAEQPDLTVNAIAVDGNKTSHMWTIIDPELTSSSGTTYKVYATNGYQNLVFDHWGDNGSTDRIRTITIGAPTTITAYYKTGISTVSFSAHYHDVAGPGTSVCDDIISGNCGPFFGNAEKSGDGGIVTGTWSQHLPRGALCGSGGPIGEMSTNGTTFTMTGTYTGTCDIFDPGVAVTISGECGTNSEITFTIGGVENKFIGDSTCSA